MSDSYFIKNLKKILDKYSQQETANLLGVNLRSITNYLSGQNPYAKTVRKVEEIVLKMETGKAITPIVGLQNNDLNEPDYNNTKVLLDMLTKQTDIIKSQQETIHYLTTNKGNATAVSSM
jgi:transcriptional regulator with XRE-family HTH domain